jgi:hypothetical protein
MTKNTETRDRTVFVRIDDEQPWTEEEMETLVEAVDEVTPDDVGVLVTPASVEYLDSDEVKDYLDDIRDQM